MRPSSMLASANWTTLGDTFKGDGIWRRTTAHHQLRSLLREFYPTFLAVFTSRFTLGIASPDARAVLAIAPTPAAAAKLSVSRVAAALRRAGRTMGQKRAILAEVLKVTVLPAPGGGRHAGGSYFNTEAVDIQLTDRARGVIRRQKKKPRMTPLK